MTTVIVLVSLVAGATALGLAWRARQGRARAATGSAADLVEPGALVTLVQFSTEVCAPCRATHDVLARVAGERVGVRHVDIDITGRPDVASRFHVLQTPTTLLVDAHGAVRARIGGAARAATVATELDRILVTA